MIDWAKAESLGEESKGVDLTLGFGAVEIKVKDIKTSTDKLSFNKKISHPERGCKQ